MLSERGRRRELSLQKKTKKNAAWVWVRRAPSLFFNDVRKSEAGAGAGADPTPEDCPMTMDALEQAKEDLRRAKTAEEIERAKKRKRELEWAELDKAAREEAERIERERRAQARAQARARAKKQQVIHDPPRTSNDWRVFGAVAGTGAFLYFLFTTKIVGGLLMTIAMGAGLEQDPAKLAVLAGGTAVSGLVGYLAPWPAVGAAVLAAVVAWVKAGAPTP